MNETILQAQDIYKSVNTSAGSVDILRGVTFSIEAAQSMALLGVSGSGKSTLLYLLAGLDTPSQGEVFLQGQPLFAVSEERRAKLRGEKIGFVFQNFQLLNHLTVLENVMLPLELAGAKNVRERASTVLGRVGLKDRLNHRPITLSGGEQQRVALARAFVVRPPLLLADEPTGSLDAANGADIMNLMLELQREANSAILLVTHDAEIAARCQQQRYMVAGSLRAEHASKT